MRKSFTWFLSLMVLLTAFATFGYAQEEQETVELYAGKTSTCYVQGNDYTVNIAVRDFIKLTKFDLGLSFNDLIYTFKGVSGVNAGLSGLTTSVTSVSPGYDVLNLAWTGGPVTIGDDVKTDVIKVHFELKGFPANTAVTYPTDLKWTRSNFWYTTSGSVYDAVNTVKTTEGSLNVNVALTGIETELSTESCAGEDVTLKVTAPEAAMYLFNEDPVVANWVWKSSNVFLAKAGEVVRIRVKSADGCISLMDEILLPETLDSVRFTVEAQDPLCYSEKGSIIVNATGGTAPYTYWVSSKADGSGALKKSNFYFSAGPGTYYVSVLDANECVVVEPWKEVTIVDDNTPIVVTPTVADVLCYGESTGSIAVSVSGGATQVSLDGNSWKNLVSGAYTFNNLPAGTYTVWAKNVNDCTVEQKGIVVGQPDGAITFDIEIDDTSCGGLNDGKITVVDVDGGTSPYEYTIDGLTWQTSNEFAGLEPIYYSLWVKDANGCVVAYDNPNGTKNKIAVQSPTDINYKVVVTDPICNNGPAMVAITNVTGGSGKYIYTFNNGATWVDTMTINVWNPPYTLPGVWVANVDTTCAVPYGTEWGVKNPPVLFAEVSDTLTPTCIDSKDGDIQLHITGGVAPYWYSLNGGKWKESDGEFTSLKVPVGKHSILVKDSKGCEIDMPLEQTISLQKNLITATSDLLINCYGDKVGTINVVVNDWAEMGDYERSKQWFIKNSSGDVTSFTPSNMGGTTTLFNAGTYIVWGVDQYTCVSIEDTVVIRQNPELKIDDVKALGASCYNVSNGIINIYASGGTVNGLLEYAFVDEDPAKLDNLTEDKWLDFDTYDPLTTKSHVAFNVNGGTYWVAVRDNNCAELHYGPIEVDGYEQLLVNEKLVTYADPLCFESMNGTITVPMGAVSGGAGSYLFTLLEWVDAGGDEGPSGTWKEKTGYIDRSTGEFTGLDKGTYAVLVEDTEDCPSYTTEEITLEDPELLSFTTKFWNMSCLNENDGIIEITVDGGTPGYEYAINNTREKDWMPFMKNSNVKTYIATEVGTYVIWVRDANGCITDSTVVTINAPEELGAEITVTDVSCNGGSNGSISIVGTGGWGPAMSTYQFKVNNGSWTSATTIFGLPKGTHTLYVRDVTAYMEPYQTLDCVYPVTFIVGEPKMITYDVMIQDVKCKDGADGMLTVNVIGGGTPWNFPLNPANSGYDVKITGDAYDSGWIRTGADFTHSFINLPHSHYTVYIQDSRGCVLKPTIGNETAPYSTIESWEVNEPESYLTLDPMWIKNVTCYGGKDGQFVLNASGGTNGYTYHTELSVLPSGHSLVEPAPGAVWQTSNTFNVGVGTWVVWVKDANGCIVGGERDKNNQPVNKWRVKVSQPDSIVWDFHTVMVGSKEVKHYVQPLCYGDWNGQIHLVDIMGGSGVYNAHVWGTSAAGEPVDTTYTNITKTGGLYLLKGVPASSKEGLNVTVLDANGCISAVDTILVKQPAELMVSLEESKGAFTCYQDNEGWIEATVTGGVEGYSYQLWRDGVIYTKWQSIASAFLVEVGHEFVVEVRDANGCITSDNIFIETPQPVAFTSLDLSCSDDVKASAKITATGTTGRMFNVWYREIGEAITNPGPFIKYNGSFAESIVISDVFLYDNENYVDRHYDVYVEDEKGCRSVSDTLTFDQVQTGVNMVITSVETTECSETIEITTNGGVGNRVVMVNGEVVTDMTVTLPRGTNVITVMDTHMCSAEQTVEVTGVYVTRDTTINTYIGETTSFVDVEAAVDSMLAVGEYQWIYVNGDCERTLNVTVVEVPRPYAIAEVQGEGDESPIKGKIAKITGTVTGIAPGEGFFVQDANAANSGIWVEHSGVNDLGIAVGKGVSVVGEVDEIAAVTSIVATDVTMVEGTVVIAAMEMNPGKTEAEMYESVLVMVPGARATKTDAETGEWTVYYEAADNVIVNDWLYKSTSVEGDFYNVTGIVNGRLDAFKLEPRMVSDVVNVTATRIDPEVANTFKVYPNPFNAQITIDNNEKLTRVVISNIAGQKVIDVEYPTREIRTANLVSGIYVISLYTENGIVKTERMIKR